MPIELSKEVNMPAISFSTMKDKIVKGEKKQTIRRKRSGYWLRYEKGDYLVGYWKMRTEGASEKLFESQLSQDPFIIKPDEWTNSLAHKDGFEPKILTDSYDHDQVKVSALGNMRDWFKNQYGEEYEDMEFVVLRWD